MKRALSACKFTNIDYEFEMKATCSENLSHSNGSFGKGITSQ